MQKLRYKMRLLAKYITAVCVLFLMMHAFILPSTKSSLIILDGVSTTRLIGTHAIKHVAHGLPVLIAQSCQCMIIIRISVARLGSSRSKN